jgi:NAD(P)-dependent dehydrogenase (short-subunit alcohol dehydrogenase family)
MTESNDQGKQPDWAIVFGASGGIGAAVLRQYMLMPNCQKVVAVSRGELLVEEDSVLSSHANKLHCLATNDQTGEAFNQSIVEGLKGTGIDFEQGRGEIVIATGILHHQGLQPEKRLEDIEHEQSLEVFATNTVLPMLYIQALGAVFGRRTQAKVAVLSARVGSIADNGLGGWYSYRASKAALNMMLATATVEFGRRFKQIKLIAFHPGTTETELSRPFRGNVSKEKLFSPDFVAECLAKRFAEHEADGQLSFVDWAGKPIPW